MDFALGTNWGFTAGDVWSTVGVIVVSLAGFLLLGISIRYAPAIISLIEAAILYNRPGQNVDYVNFVKGKQYDAGFYYFYREHRARRGRR